MSSKLFGPITAVERWQTKPPVYPLPKLRPLGESLPSLQLEISFPKVTAGGSLRRGQETALRVELIRCGAAHCTATARSDEPSDLAIRIVPDDPKVNPCYARLGSRGVEMLSLKPRRKGRLSLRVTLLLRNETILQDQLIVRVDD